jgi:hypothetical protein
LIQICARHKTIVIDVEDVCVNIISKISHTASNHLGCKHEMTKQQPSTRCFLLAAVTAITTAANLLSLCAAPSQALQPPPSSSSSVTRRDLLQKLATTMPAASTVTTVALSIPPAAHAARGAAELDLEYYLRDLMGGNRREGNVLPSQPPPLAPPRTLQGSLLPLLLNKECTPSCVPVQALIDILSKRQPSTARTVLAQDVQDGVAAIKDKTIKSFLAKSPWQQNDVSDQYYFDFTCYALWKTAASLLPDNVDRDEFVRLVGKRLVAKLQEEGLLTRPKGHTLVDSTASIQELLQVFQSSGYCKSFRIRTSDSDQDNDDPLFDELDDQSLQMKSTVDCLVSIMEPASLGASLQINGEQSRFGPDFVGTSLAAVWENYGIESKWEVFFVDAEYRPNPKGAL